jgi:predicted phosphoribosyltransferase
VESAVERNGKSRAARDLNLAAIFACLAAWCALESNQEIDSHSATARGFTMAVPFRNRTEAGRLLASKLLRYANRPDVIVLALPRGGVPVALEVAKALNAPLDVFIVRKLGVPGHEELAMGAIATGGVRVLNRDVVEGLRIPRNLIDQVSAREWQELTRRERLYRDDRPAPDLHDKIVILVDDGLATGSTMRAAVAALKNLHPAKIIVAVPTAAPGTCDELRNQVDEIVCAETPEPFYAVGAWYEDFTQVTDDQVKEMLDRQPAHSTT